MSLSGPKYSINLSLNTTSFPERHICGSCTCSSHDDVQWLWSDYQGYSYLLAMGGRPLLSPVIITGFVRYRYLWKMEKMFLCVLEDIGYPITHIRILRTIYILQKCTMSIGDNIRIFITVNKIYYSIQFTWEASASH